MFRRKYWKIQNLFCFNNKITEKDWFTASSLTNLVYNFAVGVDKIKCKYRHEYTSFIDDLIEYKCLYCNNNYKMFDENTKKRLLIYTHFLTMILIYLLYYWEKVFTDTNKWMISKNLMKLY